MKQQKLFFAVLCISLVIGCGEESSPPPQPDAAEEIIYNTYIMRGRITRMLDRSNPASELFIKHEAINDFKDMDGQAIGMPAMTMPFPVAKDVSLAGLAVGDIVQFTFRVTWRPRQSWQLTSITKLPAGTELDFTDSP